MSGTWPRKIAAEMWRSSCSSQQHHRSPETLPSACGQLPLKGGAKIWTLHADGDDDGVNDEGGWHTFANTYGTSRCAVTTAVPATAQARKRIEKVIHSHEF